MDFIENFRNSRRSNARDISLQNESKRIAEEQYDQYQDTLSNFYRAYQKWKNDKGILDTREYSNPREKVRAQSEDFDKQLDGFIDYMAEQEGASFNNDAERQKYTANALNRILNEVRMANNMTMGDYMENYGDSRDKEIYENFMRANINEYENKRSSHDDDYNRKLKAQLVHNLANSYFDSDTGKAADYLKDLRQRANDTRAAEIDSAMNLINEYEKYPSSDSNDSSKEKESKTDSDSASDSDSNSEGDNTPSESASYDIDEMAGEFILGAWGNGQDRIDNMLNAGYTLDDYNKIQQRVNEAYASGRDLHEWTNKANEKLRYW